MSDYKDTLLMPQTEFEMKANLKEKEPKIQKSWIDLDIYQSLLSRNKNNKIFTLHDGPPYANGNIHVGHALNKLLKDFIVRYKLMIGNYCHYIPGWDTHGLPIENAIAKKDKEFEKNTSPIEKRKQCLEYALEQVEIQKKQFMSLGLATDFKDIYLTLNKSFILDELELFKTMVEKELIFQDFKPVYWSWSTKCALADAEIEYADVTSPSIYVAFKMVEEDANLIIWTTTPWTIPSNLAIAVNPDIKYCYVSVENKTFIVSNDLVDKISKILGWKKFDIIKTVLGKELENKKYNHPWIKRQSPIILADYVSDKDGTGLVHNAPGFGLDDYYACKKYNIDVYCPIDDYGKFNKDINDETLNGVFYIKANDIVIDRLLENNALLHKNDLVHSVAHDWRTHKPVMYRATKQWFINIKKVSNDITNSLDNNVSSINKKTIDRIKEMISKRSEWCISRQRVWGVPIPMLFDSEHNAIYDIKLINHIISIINNEGVDIWFEKDANYFIPDWMDKTKTYFKEKDIIDVWFDSGSSYNVLKHFNIPYPADLYLEGSDQFRGWFNSSAINGTIQNGNVPYKYLLQHGFVLDEKGFKMSKSKGNVIDPLKVCSEYGADILRLWVATSEYTNDLRFGDNIIKQVTETYRKIRNTLFRYSLSNLNDFEFKKHFTKNVRIEDKFVLNQLKNIVDQINISYENYDFINIIKIVSNYTNQLSQWYFDLIKDPLYCDKKDADVRRQIQSTLFLIVKTLIIILNPIIPHTCEEAYKFLNYPEKKVSVNLEEWPEFNDEYKLSSSELQIFDQFFALKERVYSELEIARQGQLIKKNNEATIKLKNTYNLDLEQIAKWLNVAEVINNDTDKIVIENNNLCKCLRCWNHYNNKHMKDDEICIRCYDVINK